jgi:hypothetical protein
MKKSSGVMSGGRGGQGIFQNPEWTLWTHCISFRKGIFDASGTKSDFKLQQLKAFADKSL